LLKLSVNPILFNTVDQPNAQTKRVQRIAFENVRVLNVS